MYYKSEFWFKEKIINNDIKGSPDQTQTNAEPNSDEILLYKKGLRFLELICEGYQLLFNEDMEHKIIQNIKIYNYLDFLEDRIECI
jgi:hypothetical protein